MIVKPINGPNYEDYKHPELRRDDVMRSLSTALLENGFVCIVFKSEVKMVLGRF